MKPELDPRLAALVDAELKKLPPLAAPESLARDVMAVLAARANTPWWHRAWWDWPVAAKAAFLLVAVLLAGAFSSGGIVLDRTITGYTETISGHLEPFTTLLDTLRTLANALSLVAEGFSTSTLIYTALVAAILFFVCLGMGTAWVRYALKRI